MQYYKDCLSNGAFQETTSLSITLTLYNLLFYFALATCSLIVIVKSFKLILVKYKFVEKIVERNWWSIMKRENSFLNFDIRRRSLKYCV